MSDWKIFVNKSDPHDAIKNLPEAPPWRRFKGVIAKERNLPVSDEEAKSQNQRGATFEVGDDIVDMVNAALYLRRGLAEKDSSAKAV